MKKRFINKIFLLLLTPLLVTNLYASVNECKTSFGGALNSTGGKISLFGGSNINNNGPFYAKGEENVVASGGGKLCGEIFFGNSSGGGGCGITGTWAKKYKFDVLSGNGRDGDFAEAGIEIKTIDSKKEYSVFKIAGGKYLTIKDTTIKVQNNFSLVGATRLTIEGDVTIYAANMTFAGASSVYLKKNATLKLISAGNIIFAGDTSLKSADDRASNLAIIAKGNVAFPGISFIRALIYAGGNYYKMGLGKVNGAITARNIGSAGIQLVDYDGGVVDTICKLLPVPGTEPIISISDAEVIEGDSGVKNIVFTITSDKDIEYIEGLKLSYTLSSGSATAGSDYDNLNGFFFMREKTYTLSLPIIKGDTIPEADEDFFIHLTAPVENQSASFTRDRARGVIIDNDKNMLDAYDKTSSFSNPAIKTHVVNEPFQLKIVSIQPDNNPASSFTDMENTQMKIVPTSSCTNDATGLNMNGFVPFSLTTHEQLSPTFKIDKAYKDAKVQFYWEDSTTGAKKASCSTDRFAIRPKKYIITKPASIKAGENFNIIVTALDAENKPVSNYAENGSVYKIDINETKAHVGCTLGTVTKSKHNFYTGRSLVDLNYNDVGMLGFKVSEKVGSEFAIVDSSDGSGNSRFIEHGVNNIGVDASSFTVNFSYVTQNSHPSYTYYSANPMDMGAIIEANVTVKNALGQPVHNYSDGCYAKDVAVSLAFTQTGAAEVVEFKNQDTTPATDIGSVGGRYSYNVYGTSFTHGVGGRDLYMNFGRVVDTPKLPLNMRLSNPAASIGTLPGIVNSLDRTISFLYARAHGQDEQSGVGSNFVATIDYEAYLPSSVVGSDYGLPSSLSKGKDDIRWSILPNDTAFAYKTGTTPKLKFGFGATITASTPQTVSITSATTPHADVLTYDTKSYLDSSQEITGIKVKMLSPTNQWSGKGKIGKVFDDTASREIKRRMEW
jgi:hypothetical protein